MSAVRKTKSVSTELETVTPNMAAKWLEFNANNRPPSERTVERYAKAMKTGKWSLNGESIKFSAEGNLLDGQHRLTAICKSGVSVPMFVVYGLPRETFDTIDIGKTRTGGDVISILEPEYAKYSNTICAAVRLLDTYNSLGHFKSRGRGRISNYEVLDVFKKFPGIARSAGFAHRLEQAPKIVPLSALTVLHFMFSKKDQDEAEKFLHDLDSGANLNIDDPVFILRRRLFELNERYRRKSAEMVIPYIVKSWNATREGKKIQNLRIGDNEEMNLEIK